MRRIRLEGTVTLVLDAAHFDLSIRRPFSQIADLCPVQRGALAAFLREVNKPAAAPQVLAEAQAEIAVVDDLRLPLGAHEDSLILWLVEIGEQLLAGPGDRAGSAGVASAPRSLASRSDPRRWSWINPLSDLTCPKGLPQRRFGLPVRVPEAHKPAPKRDRRNVPDRLRTCDLRFRSPTSPQDLDGYAAARCRVH
jgi:hypothetical protein